MNFREKIGFVIYCFGGLIVLIAARIAGKDWYETLRDWILEKPQDKDNFKFSNN